MLTSGVWQRILRGIETGSYRKLPNRVLGPNRLLLLIVIGVFIAVLLSLSTTPNTKLAWAPPRLLSPTVIHIKDGSGVVNLSTSKDYVLKLPPRGRLGALWITGGHNVVLVGGQITISTTANQTDNGKDNTDTGIYIDGATGTVHIEGVLITSQPNVMFDGIDVNAPLATVQIENVRVDNVWGSYTTEHADVIQTWGGFRALRIDDLTANGDYQGLTIFPDLGPEGSVDIRDVDLTADSPPAALAATSIGGGHMLWLTGGTTSCTTASSIRLSNVYIRSDWRGLGASHIVWPQANGPDLGCRAKIRGNQVTWPSLAVEGSVTIGSPPNGPFVPVGRAGNAYRSPGYVR